MITITHRELDTAACYQERPPMNLVGHLSNQESDKHKVRDWLKQAHEALEIFDKLAAEGDMDAAALLRDCLWPQSPWCREAVISASETSFKGLGAYIEQDLVDVAHGGLTAECIENGHRTLNTAARQSVNHKLSRMSRWSVCNTSPVIKENDCKQPKPCDDDRVEAKTTTLTNSTFEVGGKGDSPFLGTDVYDQMLEWDPFSLLGFCPVAFDRAQHR